VEYRAQSAVWQIDRDLTVRYRDAGGAGSISARQVLIATGALERPMPLPGWTLPGVMSCGAGAGAAQVGRAGTRRQYRARRQRDRCSTCWRRSSCGRR
jgi:NADPH-dependent 2,4-dienoyl-CoA reductase/sulfur reductase-like enzyme